MANQIQKVLLNIPLCHQIVNCLLLYYLFPLVFFILFKLEYYNLKKFFLTMFFLIILVHIYYFYKIYKYKLTSGFKYYMIFPNTEV